MAADRPPVGGGARAPASREPAGLGQGYAEITKLREICAHHERNGSKFQSRSAHLQTKIEGLRHAAAILREKAEETLQKIPELEQEMLQHERDIKAFTSHTGGRSIGSDVTGLHFKIKKIQQKIVDVQHKARTLEHKAAQRAQKAAELKVKSDRFLERARAEQLEADQYRQRADRLQLATERGLPPIVPGPTPQPSAPTAVSEPPNAPPTEPPDEL